MEYIGLSEQITHQVHSAKGNFSEADWIAFFKLRPSKEIIALVQPNLSDAEVSEMETDSDFEQLTIYMDALKHAFSELERLRFKNYGTHIESHGIASCFYQLIQSGLLRCYRLKGFGISQDVIVKTLISPIEEYLKRLLELYLPIYRIFQAKQNTPLFTHHEKNVLIRAYWNEFCSYFHRHDFIDLNGIFKDLWKYYQTVVLPAKEKLNPKQNKEATN